MEVTYFGHSAFRIKTRTTSLLTDPFEAKMVGFKLPPVEAQIVTVSHQHADHNNTAAVKGVKKVIAGPGEYEIMGISILGFPTYHDKRGGEERGLNTIYVIEAEGLRLAHLGDLGHKLSDEMVEEIGEIQVLMLPVGGVASLDPEEAAAVVRSIEPKIVLPMHYQEENLNQAVFSKLARVEEFLKEVGLPVERAPKLLLNEFGLGEETKVVILDVRK